jgi:hypothetical protein
MSLPAPRRRSLIAALVLLAACGGSKKGDVDTPDPGSTHEGGGEAGAAPIDAGPPPDAAPPPAAVTFVLRNSGKEELALNLDRGWGGVLLAWSGKPPKAKPILMFPTFCTAACDAPDEERCPSCPQPEKVKDIREAQKLEKVAPGAELEVRWDAQVHAYEKCKGTRDGKTKRCQCFRTAEVAANTYTVRACGLRLTTTTDKSSALVCAEGQMTLPADGPLRVELDFVK